MKKLTAKKTNKEFMVPVPPKVWVVVGSRGGARLYLGEDKAQAEWERQQKRRNEQLAAGKDTGTDPMLVEYLPDIPRPKRKAKKVA